MKNEHTDQESSKKTASQISEAPPLSEKKRRELWLYLAVSIAAVEMILAVGGLCYGFIASPGKGVGAHSFPWLVWGSLSLIIPAVILLAVHQADVGLFRKPKGGKSEEEWQQQLPERMQKLYRVIKGAPVVAVLLGVVVFGATLLTIDGALSAVGSFASALAPHVPYLAGALAAIIGLAILAAVWLSYRTRRLYAEYQFRREVLEKTGVIIVDKGSIPLAPGESGAMPYALSDGKTTLTIHNALESGDIVDVESSEVTPEAKEKPEH